jgi:pyruvate carboxylase
MLVTDTHARRAQSLLSTRMRSHDMFLGADGTATSCGTASRGNVGRGTFDTAFSFLLESPWERSGQAARNTSQHSLQMLLRWKQHGRIRQLSGQPRRAFVAEVRAQRHRRVSASSTRYLDPNMEVAMTWSCSEKLCPEATVCYTGDFWTVTDKYRSLLCRFRQWAGKARGAPVAIRSCPPSEPYAA